VGGARSEREGVARTCVSAPRASSNQTTTAAHATILEESACRGVMLRVAKDGEEHSAACDVLGVRMLGAVPGRSFPFTIDMEE
jgi:hypothetical protein